MIVLDIKPFGAPASIVDEDVDASRSAAEIVVNATVIGLFPDVAARLNLDVESLQPGMIVADVIPNPPRTSLIRDEQARGCVTLDGLGMLVNQGAISIEHWNGIAADRPGSSIWPNRPSGTGAGGMARSVFRR